MADEAVLSLAAAEASSESSIVDTCDGSTVSTTTTTTTQTRTTTRKLLLVMENDDKNGDTIGHVRLSEPADVERAVTAAAEAYRSWSRLPSSHRVQYLYDVLGRLRGGLRR